MAKLVLVVSLIVCLGALAGAVGWVLINKPKPIVQNSPTAKETNGTSKLTLEQIKNAEYYSPIYTKKVKLKDGKY